MKINIQRSNERGIIDHGWLLAKHSFSFASYHDPDKMGFGALLVLNEDLVAPGKGFPAHSHTNMEIVTIVLEGLLRHEDSKGNQEIIKPGTIQRMSAGTGITHAEYNASNSENLHLLQIWIKTRKENIDSSYETRAFSNSMLKNKLIKIAAGTRIKGNNFLYINQNATLFLGMLDENKKLAHRATDNSYGTYVFVIEGEITFSGSAMRQEENIKETLRKGDAAEISETDIVNITANTKSDVLIIEVPL